ncbi:NUDIX hydrolase [Salimicrobium halophilum]|uniref:ADP-ribose pyrophosphatase n=1 Tax=Salimicrobium halophilum TaxID=86666 RepID=A0A1G8PYP9_9BACI|nr:NUDIX hydrolase [Salimicrobium halophilum]SDI96960.1 ADP-ribose pyrophosphatase [Salimicrobium halophilum]
MTDRFEEKTVSSTSIYEGKIIDVKVDTVQLPDGNQSKREIVTHPGAVAILAITDENKLVMVEQYRKPLEKSLIEIPAGKLEKGETPEGTAIRELEEETGYTTDHIKLINSFYTSPGFADEIVYIYLADNLQRLEQTVEGDEDEFVTMKEVTIEEAEELEKNRRIHDAKTSYALMYAKQYLSEY